MTDAPFDPPAVPVIRVEATLTRAEFVWTFRTLMRATGRNTPIWGWPVLVIALALGIALWDGGWFAWVLVVAGALGLVVGVVLAVMPYAMYRSVPADRRTQTVECSPAGISSSTADATVSYAWSAVRQVARSDTMMLLVTHERGEGIAIATRALTPDQRRDLDLLIAQHAPHASSIG